MSGHNGTSSPGKIGQRAVLREITPEQASKHLEKNEEREFQRSVSQTFVNQLASDIREGRWAVNGETIIIDREGRVIDGQHRLWACIEAAKPITTWVIEGVDPEMFTTIDTGKSRKAKDMVSILSKREGFTRLRSSAESAAGRAAGMLSRTTNGRWVQGLVKVGNGEVVSFIEAHRDLLDDAAEFSAFGKWPLPLSYVLAIRFLTKRKFPDSVAEFWHPLQSGIGIARADSPLALLREKAIKHPRQADFIQGRDIFAITIKGWNAYAVGKPVKLLRFSAGVDPFPSICLTPGVEPKHVADPRVGVPLMRRNLVQGRA